MASDKKHRYQPQIVSKYVKVVNLMKQLENVLGLARYGSLHYEKLHGDKEGISNRFAALPPSSNKQRNV